MIQALLDKLDPLVKSFRIRHFFRFREWLDQVQKHTDIHLTKTINEFVRTSQIM